MELSNALYSLGKDDQKISFNYALDASKALNWVGFAWVDASFGFAKNIMGRHSLIVTDNHLIARDDYIDLIKAGSLICLVFSGEMNKLAGASEGRLRKAENKLKAKGIRVKYFSSLTSMKNFISNVSEDSIAKASEAPPKFEGLRLVKKA